MERTGAEPIRDDAGGELAREPDVEGKKSASDPKSPGVSGLLLDDKLGLLDRDFSTVMVEVAPGAAPPAGTDAPGFGVSTTRRMRGCRGTGEFEARDVVVNGVLGREPMETEPDKDGKVPDNARSALTEGCSRVARGTLALGGLAFDSASEFLSDFAVRSFSSVARRSSFLVVWALFADFATGDPNET